MATNGMHNLATLIKRLEAATARLEDIAESTDVTRAPAAASSAAPPPPAPPCLQVGAVLCNAGRGSPGALSTPSRTATRDSGGAQALLEGFQAQRTFLLVSTKAKKPDMAGAGVAEFQDIIKPISEAIGRVGAIKDANRQSEFYNHLSTVAEGALVLAWVTVDNKPWKHVEESLGSAQFFGNRVLKEFKEKDPKQVEFVQAFYQIFRDLTEYIKQYFPSGVIWNPKGKPAKEAMAEVSAQAGGAPAAPAPSAGGPPPPPPPPPPSFLLDDAAPAGAASKTSGGLGAVFSDLNKGESVTKGLRKVDKSEMTHKNPSLRASSQVPEKDATGRGKSPAPGKKPKPESMRVKKPPKKELDGNKWLVENYENPAEPIVIEASLAHSILISKCNKTTIIIKGKANAVTVENTNRLSVVLDSLVSTVDVVKSQNFAVQVLGSLPAILMDQIDGAQVYLSKESMSTKIFSSKSANINLNVIAGPDDDFKEIPLPSQLCSYFDTEKGDMVNEIVAHAG
ncbi:related to adenylate cyclase-associated protein [Cephalotrichum gorgonifer]|uniref:Adenylyl cyclase-associated protein n=1 Tax=Cephalotrichum gorgonifer TaxID=2041049 RepID=A0AAE8N0M2_9PEZI|nr:related to adenylate cyclase-associated protein [Cephalotrichum gorgonifer]